MAARAVVILDHVLDKHAQEESTTQQGWSDSASNLSLASSKITTPSTAGTHSECTAVRPTLLNFNGRATDTHIHPQFFPNDYSQHFPQLYQQPTFSAPPPPSSFFAYPPPTMPPPPQQPNPQPHFAVPQVPQAVRSSRPALSVYTTVAPPAQAAKLPTPIHSPWIDTATTPTRYAQAYQWTDRFM
ncbi:hypothetical protein AAT19DRAFT_11515 [Rhodotorula toruloides]|uniref:Uncharacterized protein n=1 Tax=Rhodotorula toruloides TaxID=5286 RepID=A0A2S9ZX31_RHOTO|nr:hypothetical protein AAT19DRAFT_11515 [Rhodotorula toruloides]